MLRPPTSLLHREQSEPGRDYVSFCKPGQPYVCKLTTDSADTGFILIDWIAAEHPKHRDWNESASEHEDNPQRVIKIRKNAGRRHFWEGIQQIIIPLSHVVILLNHMVKIMG